MILVAGYGGASLSRAEREVMTAARAAGGEITFVALGGSDASGENAGSFGASTVIVFEGSDDEAPYTAAAAAALADVGAELEPEAVLIPGDERGLELGPRVAERLGGSAVTNAVAVETVGGARLWTRPVFGGKALAKVRTRSDPAVVTVRPGAFAAAVAEGPVVEAEIRSLPAAGDEVRIVSREAGEASAFDLEGAKIVISGGRGVGGAEGFRQLEELASAIGGTVGASLAAVDEGWADGEQQVGLTGKVIKPELYVAIGISGASQHLAGMSAAGTVVAINTDPDAPIFEAADLGVVMDLKELLPALIEECRRRVG